MTREKPSGIEGIIPGEPIGPTLTGQVSIHIREKKIFVGGVETTIDEFRKINGIGEVAVPTELRAMPEIGSDRAAA